MTQRDRTKIKSSLSSKGFKNTGGDHEYYYFYREGKKKKIFTKISRGSKYKTYGDGLLREVKKQLYLSTKKKLLDFIDCPMSKDNYIDELKEAGEL